jgi:hypothetical protein
VSAVVRSPTADEDRRPRQRRQRAPIDTSATRPTTPEEFTLARRLLFESGVVGLVQARLDHEVGRPRSLSVEGLLVAMTVNGLRRQHLGTVVDATRVLNSFTAEQREALGITDWDEAESYDRTDRLFNLLAKALGDTWEAEVDGARQHIDVQWFANRVLRPTLARLPARSKSLAVDGTDVETWGALRGELLPEDADGEADQNVPADPTSARPSKAKEKRRAQVFGKGPDGRKVYTPDPDARAGHRSATGSRPAGYYVGYELHLGVQTRDVAWSDGIEKVTLGPEVPPVVATVSLVPTGTHRGKAIVPTLIAAKEAGLDIEDVVWDRGYSQSVPEHTSHPLNRAGIHQTFRPMEHQRPAKPFSSDMLLIEGALFSARLPRELRGPLPMPPAHATREQLESYERPFNQRGRWRCQRLSGPDLDGVTRWMCPFHAGFLRSRSLPQTMRRSRSAPLVELPDGASCCSGTVSVSAAELPYWQRLPAGTTAWRISMGRREAVEGANGMLKGGFVNIERKFLRVLGLTKTMLMLAFTLVGYNIDRIRSFRAATKATLERVTKRSRKKRRTGTWADLLGDFPQVAAGRDPPT